MSITVRDRTAILADRSLPLGAAWRLPITVTFSNGSTVEYYNITGGDSSATVNMHSVPSFSNAVVSILVEGVEMPENSETITSAAVPILIERKMTRA